MIDVALLDMRIQDLMLSIRQGPSKHMSNAIMYMLNQVPIRGSSSPDSLNCLRQADVVGLELVKPDAHSDRCDSEAPVEQCPCLRYASVRQVVDYQGPVVCNGQL